MKKILLFASAIALVTSCAKTDLGTSEGPEPGTEGKGITFSASVSESTDTKAEYIPDGDVFNQKWYADKDKISIIFKGNVDTDFNLEGAMTTDLVTAASKWKALVSNDVDTERFALTFKASASSETGYFVADGDKNTLWLQGAYTKETIPSFRAFWPAVEADEDLGEGGSEGIVNLPSLANQQVQKTINGHGIVENVFMISESNTDVKDFDENDNSVSRNRFNLNFKRTQPIVHFKITTNDVAAQANDNREYVRDYVGAGFDRFGKFERLALTTKGSKSVAKATSIDYGEAKWDMLAEDLSKGFIKSTKGDEASVVTVGFGQTNDGLVWSNEATAFMVVANVDRAEFRKEGEEENLEAKYQFEKTTFVTTESTEKDWDVNKNDKQNWYEYPEVNLDKVPYIVYEKSQGEYVLQLNSTFVGSVKDIFNTEGAVKNFFKTDAINGIKVGDITHFISKAKLSDAEIAGLAKFENLTNLTLLEATSIPSKAFAGLTKLTYVNLPKVATVANVDAFPKNAYTDVYMGGFDFNDNANALVRERLLDQANLVKADVSFIDEIAAAFPDLGVTFQEFKQLKEITLKPGVVIGANGFKDCAELNKIQFPQGTVGGSVTLNGTYVFANCVKLEKVAISNKEIFDGSFSGCTKLEVVTDGSGNIVVPTKVGAYAFLNVTALKDIDLSVATTIGTAAFKGCAGLVGNDKIEKGRMVLRVNGITKLENYVFENCTNLRFISFANVTKVGVDFLKGAGNYDATAANEGKGLQEIEFLKVFTVDSKLPTEATTNFFGTTKNTKLFIDKAQEELIGNDLYLTGNASGSVQVKSPFAAVQFNK